MGRNRCGEANGISDNPILPRKLPISAWALDDRPREKLLSRGASALSNAELLAILLGSGNAEESAVELAQHILNATGNLLNELGKLGVRELTSRFKGIGPAKAVTIMAAIELGKRRAAEEPMQRTQIRSSQDIYRLMYPLLADLPHEEFWVICLATSNRIKGCECVSSGGMDGTMVDVRVLFHLALNMKAANIIVAHNHPGGGKMQPSHQDDRVTTKISEAGKMLDIRLLDHIIVGQDQYYSFADEGRLGT